MIVLLCGNKGVGKDTVASLITEIEPITRMSFTDPFKPFAGAVFGFDDEVLYGPSEKRAELDTRYGFLDDKGEEVEWSVPDEMWRIAEVQLRRLGPDFIRDIYPGLPDGLVQLVMHHLENNWFANVGNDYGITAREVLQTLGTEFGRDLFGEDVWVNHALRRAAKVDGHVVITDGRYANEVKRVREAGGRVLRIVREDEEVSTDAHPSEHGLEGMDPGDFDFTLRNDGKSIELLRSRVAFAWSLLRVANNLPPYAISESERKVPRREPEAA